MTHPARHTARRILHAAALAASAIVAVILAGPAGCTPAREAEPRDLEGAPEAGAGSKSGLDGSATVDRGTPKMSAGVALEFVEAATLGAAAGTTDAGEHPIRLELRGPAGEVLDVELEASKGAELSGRSWRVALGDDGEGALDASVVVPAQGCSIVARVRTAEGRIEEAVCRMPGADTSEAAKGTTRIIDGRPVRTERSR